MKKRFTSFLFALAILIPCFMIFTACGEETKVTGVKAYINDNEVTIDNNTIVVPYATATDWKNTLKVILTYSDDTTSEVASTDYSVMGEPGVWEVNPEGYDITITYMSYDPIDLKIVVTGSEVNVPQVATGLVYDNGNIVTGLSVMQSDPYEVCEGSNTATDAGNYSFKLRLKPGFIWADGTVEEKSFDWSVARKEVSKPTATYKTFNGDWQNVVTLTGNEGYYVESGNADGFNAGNYSAVFALDNNHCWTGGDTENYTLNWSINKLKISIPTAPATNFVYNGQVQGLDCGAGYTFSPDANNVTAETNAGTYTTVFTLESDNYEWNNVDPTGDKSVTWTIERKAVAKPRLADTYTFTYDGVEHTGIVCDNNDQELGGIAYYWEGSEKATNASDNGYTVEFTLVDNYRWENASNSNDTANITLTWYLNRKTVEVEPTAVEGLQYILGTSSYSGIQNIDGTGYYYDGGDTVASGAGTYSATFRLDNNYQWATGENKTANKVVTWTVARAKAELPIRPTTAPEYTGHTQFVVEYEQYVSPYVGEGSDLAYQYNAGTYTTKFILGEVYEDDFEWDLPSNLSDLPSGYTYIEGDNSIVVEWYIAKARITKPTAKTGVADYLVFDDTDKEADYLVDGMGDEFGFQHFNEIYSETDRIWFGAVTSRHVGKYRTVFRLLNTQTTENYIWADNTDEDFYIEWTITPAESSWLSSSYEGGKIYDGKGYKPEFIGTYNGKTRIEATYTYTVNVDSGTPIELTSNPDTQPKDAGTYYITATFSSPEGNFTTLTKNFIYTISPLTFNRQEDLIINKDLFVYDGETHSPDYRFSSLFGLALVQDQGQEQTETSGTQVGGYNAQYYYTIHADYQNNIKGNVYDDDTKVQFTIPWDIVNSPFTSVTIDGVEEDLYNLTNRVRIEHLSTIVFTMAEGYVPLINGQPLALDSGKDNQYTYLVDLVTMQNSSQGYSDTISISVQQPGEDVITITQSSMDIYFLNSIQLDGSYTYDLTNDNDIWYSCVYAGNRAINLKLDEKYTTKYQLAYQVDDGSIVDYVPDQDGYVSISNAGNCITLYIMSNGQPIASILRIYVMDYDYVSTASFTIFGTENRIENITLDVDYSAEQKCIELWITDGFIGDMKLTYSDSLAVQGYEIYNPQGQLIEDFRVAESGVYTIKLVPVATGLDYLCEIPLKLTYNMNNAISGGGENDVLMYEYTPETLSSSSTFEIDDRTNAQTNSVFKTTFATVKNGDYVTKFPVETGLNEANMKVTATFYGVEYNYYQDVVILASDSLEEKTSPYSKKLFNSFEFDVNDEVKLVLGGYNLYAQYLNTNSTYTSADIISALALTKDNMNYELVEDFATRYGVDDVKSITLSLHESGKLLECLINVNDTIKYAVYFRLNFTIDNNTNITMVTKTPSLANEVDITDEFDSDNVTIEVDRSTTLEITTENRDAMVVVKNSLGEVISVAGGKWYPYNAKFLIQELGEYTIVITATDGTTKEITLNVTGVITPLFGITYNGKTLSQDFDASGYPIVGDYEFDMMTFAFTGYYGTATVNAGDNVQLSAVSLVSDIYKDDETTKIDNLNDFTLVARLDETGEITGIENGVYVMCVAKIAMEGIEMSANIIIVFAEKPAPLAITVNGRTLKMDYIQVPVDEDMTLTVPGGGNFVDNGMGTFYAVAGAVANETTELPVTIAGLYAGAVTIGESEPVGDNVTLLPDTTGEVTGVVGTQYTVLMMEAEVMGMEVTYQIILVFADEFEIPEATPPVE